MGIFSVFGKKKEVSVDVPQEIDFGPLPDKEQSFQPQQFSDRDIQLLIAKLDLISQKLDIMDRRLQFIEDVAKESR